MNKDNVFINMVLHLFIGLMLLSSGVSGQDCTELGVTIEIPENGLYYPGDLFYINIIVCNPTSEPLEDIPLIVTWSREAICILVNSECPDEAVLVGNSVQPVHPLPDKQRHGPGRPFVQR